MTDIIRDLELSVRATNVLTRYGRVKTIDDFLALDRATVMGLPKSGTRTWEEIERVQLYLLREGKLNAPAPTIDRHTAVLTAFGALLQREGFGVGPKGLSMVADIAWDAADALLSAQNKRKN
jgi:hypothetical protein